MADDMSAPASASIYADARRLVYVGPGGCDVARSAFLSRAACATVVALCEAHGDWGAGADYAFATRDVEVDRFPALRDWLLRHAFPRAIAARCERAHGRRIKSLDDCFVVKYDARGGLAALVSHRDAGAVSFMVALSAPGDYAGGGTRFDESGLVVHCGQGDVLTFDAALFHSGVPITAGTRYLLVGFGHAREAHPGDVRLDDLQVVRRRAIAKAWVEAVDVKPALVRDARLLAAAEKSFWVNRKARPRCAVEAFALKMLFAQELFGDDAAGGAEVWAHLLPPGGAEASLPLHFDKDERLLADRDEWRHPALSTVTYLSDGGAPTIIFDTTLAGGRGAGGPSMAFVSHPVAGKHLIFQGSLLHGVAHDLARPTPAQAATGPRLTLLVNLWRGAPLGLAALPDDIVAALSKRYFTYDPRRLDDVVVIDAAGAALSALDGHVDGFTAPLPVGDIRAAAETALVLLEAPHDLTATAE
ncbi:hypothetical protein M885DRAFT_517108 [Pelagophyceae sp. CCMP2097]|nr:hypothetical protein M885DRAFT_517108 [Pelagophyceae sp. CCMP2097]